jgi:hypothetical protein
VLKSTLISLSAACVIFFSILLVFSFENSSSVRQEVYVDTFAVSEHTNFVFDKSGLTQRQYEVNAILRKFLHEYPLVRESLIHYLAYLDAHMTTSTQDELVVAKLGYFTDAHRDILNGWCATISHGNLLPCKSSSIRQIAHWNPDEMLVWMTLKKRFLDQIAFINQ